MQSFPMVYSVLKEEISIQWAQETIFEKKHTYNI